ncbi:ribosome maturation factor RimM [Roseibium denhamense]|uniref:Ribosome maturation factor RimM n=1 Tax=Roseibium denhamense TaxID=76305 RepID=A0ABY1PCE6_9HYPH|nr:ribosome maturation factor RimM [Roseibium denhamense]MTI05285.1 ribosome maturation factor RimM [Roseibium denhamense]SMP30554.1 16S rRNA processing protein RimM [Roseibium denhamense]
MALKETSKVLMARIGAAHGIRGEVRVKAFGDDPLSFADYGILTTKDGSRSFEVDRARVQKTVVITKFKAINDRNQAEELNGLELFISRDQLPEPDEDEFYYSDLNGLAVTETDGSEIGKVVAVQDFGAGDLLEIRPMRGKTFYVPFTREFVPKVDVQSGTLTVSLPDDYLSDDESGRSSDEPDR